MWQGGFGSTKEDSSQTWQCLASLGLATLSIDLRHHGARGSGAAELERVCRDPSLYAEVIRGTVSDLRSAIDYLETQPYCFGCIASAGVSLGGAVATILTATDERIKAALIMSTPGRWREVLTHARIPRCSERTLDPEALASAQKILSPLDPARFIGRIAPRPVLILSGLDDEIVVTSTARALQTAARRPKTIVNYSGGHDPFSGPVRAGNGEAIASFLLRNVVEPTYGVAGNADGTR
jgi:fermentation-respiration switch protein FrsA (DUF1100 family)